MPSRNSCGAESHILEIMVWYQLTQPTKVSLDVEELSSVSKSRPILPRRYYCFPVIISIGSIFTG